jgi:hypothetical protein
MRSLLSTYLSLYGPLKLVSEALAMAMVFAVIGAAFVVLP